jgi:Gpi18-like mannosyltransferase
LRKIINTIDNKIRNIFENKKILLLFSIIIFTIISFIIRFSIINYESPDYIIFLEKWFYRLKELGGLKGLAENIGDYNVPYLTIISILTYLPIEPLYSIKFVSIIFDYIGAIFAALIVYEILKNDENKSLFAILTYCIVINLPTVFINSAAWAQCDFIYVSFILMSIYSLLKNKTMAAFIFLGISFSFKLQFIFILPLYVLLYFRKKNFSFLNFMIIPIMNIILCLPAVFMGKSIIDCFKIYLNQTETYTNKLTFNFPNLYNIFSEFLLNTSNILVLFTIVLIFLLILYVQYNKIKIDGKDIINLGILISFLTVFFLPRMHERYAFMVEILSIIYLFINKKGLYLPIVLQLCILFAYTQFLSTVYDNELLKVCSIVMFISLLKLAHDTIKDITLKKDNNVV